jgi:HEAT repeat protein
MLHHGFRINECLPTWVLLALYQDATQPPEKRWAACLALGMQGAPQAFEALRAGLHAPEWELRRFALEALQRHPRARDAAPDFIAALFDIDVIVQQTACKICGDLRLADAHDGIVQLLASEHPDVRDTAANTLALLWRDSDFDPVFHLYRHDRRRAVRIAAAKTLRHKAAAANWRRLFACWSVDPEPRHRLWGCELVARFGRQPDIGLVLPMLHDRNRNVRLAAQQSLASLQAACGE